MKTITLLSLVTVLWITEAVGQTTIYDYTDATYGGKVRQLSQSGSQHNWYYHRNAWNSDNSYMLGIKDSSGNFILYRYNGDGSNPVQLNNTQNWRVGWSRTEPNYFYTHNSSTKIYKYNVVTKTATEMIQSPTLPAGLTFNSTEGPTFNQAGDRLFIQTTNTVTGVHSVRTYRINGTTLDTVRTFDLDGPNGKIPSGFEVGATGNRYTGYQNYIGIYGGSTTGGIDRIVTFDESGNIQSQISKGGGHYDFSPNGKLAYYTEKSGNVEIHVVDVVGPLAGTNDKVVYSGSAANIRNGHCSWPDKVNNWFVAGFFPDSGSTPLASYAPPYDEILQINVNLDNTVSSTKFLARTGTESGNGAGFWAQVLPSPSADGTRISFNSNRNNGTGSLGGGTPITNDSTKVTAIDQHILTLGGAPPRE